MPGARSACSTRCSRPRRCARSSPITAACRACSTSRPRSRAPRRASGVIPAAAAAADRGPMPRRARSTSMRWRRVRAIAGNLAIPLVRALTRACRASTTSMRARYVHWGATSQDAIDTGLVLQLREALASDRRRSRTGCPARSRRGRADARATPLLRAARWLQQALPVTLGLKAAGWLSAVDRHRGALAEARAHAASRSAVRRRGRARSRRSATRGLDVAEALAAELELALPDIAVARAARSRRREVGDHARPPCRRRCGKIARDVSLLMQTEVAEAFEPAAPGRGGSSTMPHKRNPVGCAAIARRGDARAGAGGDDARGDGAGARARPGRTGTPSGRRCRRSACSPPVRSTQTTAIVAGSAKSTRRRMAREPRATRGLIFAEAVQMALADAHRTATGARAGRARLRQARAAKRRHSARRARRRCARHARISRRADSIALLDPAHYIGEARAVRRRACSRRDEAGSRAAKQAPMTIVDVERARIQLPRRRPDGRAVAACCPTRSAPNLAMWDAQIAGARAAASACCATTRAGTARPRSRPGRTRSSSWRATCSRCSTHSKASNARISAACRWAGWPACGSAVHAAGRIDRLVLANTARADRRRRRCGTRGSRTCARAGMAAIADGVLASAGSRRPFASARRQASPARAPC